MSARSLSVVACLLVLSSVGSAQFAAHPWTFEGSGATGASIGSVSGPDELTLEVLNCIGYAGSVVAESVAPDTGRFRFDLAGEEWISSCSQCGLGFCGGTTTLAGSSCAECSPWCAETVLAEFWGGDCAATSTWDATWTLDVIEGRCWQIAISQDGWSLDCNTRLVASNLVFEAAPDVTLTSVEGTPAYKATVVRLVGLGLDAVEHVFVDGEETTILAQSPTEIVIRPAAGPAGYGHIALRDDTFLLADEPGVLAKWPAASADVAPGLLDVLVEAGLPGNWQLVVSLGTMAPFVVAGSAGSLVVDVVGSPWFWLPAVLDADGLGAMTLPLPQSPGLSGLDVYLQARTPAGFGAPYASAFSNLVAVELP